MGAARDAALGAARSAHPLILLFGAICPAQGSAAGLVLPRCNTDAMALHLAEIFIRDNWLSNRVFRPYDDILDHGCFAWNKLVDQPWTIMLIGLRDWAHRF